LQSAKLLSLQKINLAQYGRDSWTPQALLKSPQFIHPGLRSHKNRVPQIASREVHRRRVEGPVPVHNDQRAIDRSLAGDSHCQRSCSTAKLGGNPLAKRPFDESLIRQEVIQRGDTARNTISRPDLSMKASLHLPQFRSELLDFF
jgi:hypothetical protein